MADAHLQLGKIQERRSDDKSAEAELAKAAEIYRELVEKQPGDFTLRLSAARAVREFGDFLLMRKRLAEAATLYKSDLDWTRSMLATNEVLGFQSELSDAYYRTGTLALKKGDRTTATDCFRRCLELRQNIADLRPPDDRSKLRVVNAQARFGQHEPAAASMDALLKAHPKDGYYCIEGACNFALCAEAIDKSDDKTRRHYLDRAIQELETLVGELKYGDAVRLKTDPDLDALRGEPKFAELIQAVETKRGK